MGVESENQTDRSATAEEINEWGEENDEPHPVFEVPHRPERERVIDRLARFVCNDCGRDWKQYTHDGKEISCIRCRSENIEERQLNADTEKGGDA